MTVSSTKTIKSHNGDGSNVTFPYDFKIFADADLTVILRSSTGTETVQELTTHYSVTNAGNTSGGNVVFVSAPASGVTVVIRRNIAQTQTTDYTANDPFPAESHEDALDRLTFITQQQQEEINRTIKLSRTNTMASTEFTTSSTDRASKVLAFDSSGELSITQELGSVRGNWSAGTTYAQRDIVKDTSTNNIFIAITAHTSSGSQPLTSNADAAKWSLLVDAATATAAAATATTKAGEAAASATSAASATVNVQLAEDFATKTTGEVVSGTGKFSSEAHALGGTDVTNVTGSAKEWALGGGTNPSATVHVNSGDEYSAKGYAVGAIDRGSNTGKHSAKDWATYTAGTVDGTLYSAKYYAQQAETNATDFSNVYQGTHSSDPSGGTVSAGDLYYNSSSQNLKFYNGTAWVAIEAADTSSFSTKGFATAMAVAL